MKNKMIMLISLLFLVTLVGCENVDKSETWKVSPTFTLPVTFSDGIIGEYLLIGEEGKVGFLVGSGKKGEAVRQPIVVNEVNKYMWHFWGKNKAISGDFKVIGIDEKRKEHPVLVSGTTSVWTYSNTSISPNNGADSHIPSNMVFPTSGLWKLEIYFNDKFFDEIVVSVEGSSN